MTPVTISFFLKLSLPLILFVSGSFKIIKNSYYSWYYVPDAVLELYLVSHLVLITTLGGRRFHSHFRDEKTGLGKLNQLPKALQALLLSLHFSF